MENKTNDKPISFLGQPDSSSRGNKTFFFLKKRPRGHKTHLSNTAITQIKAAIYSYQNSFIKSDTNVLASIVTVVAMSTCFPY